MKLRFDLSVLVFGDGLKSYLVFLREFGSGYVFVIEYIRLVVLV